MTTETYTGRSSIQMPAWYHGEQRWTQLTFVEDDPLTFDINQWAEVMERTSSTAICISAGGYIAFYPTKIPLHYRSAYLGNRDLFGEVVDLARSRGMAVMARVDPHAVHQDVRDAHPEWIARTEDGEFFEHWAYRGIYVTDAYGGYNWEFTTEVAREIAADYDVDAIFANRWQGHSPSYTDTARRLFHDASGLELPTSADPVGGERWVAYHRWRRSRLSELVAHWDRAVQAVKPTVRFIPNLGSFAARELDDSVASNHVPFFLVDHQARNEGETQWAAGRDAKRTRSIYPDKPVGLITSVGPESHGYRWKDSVNASAETVTWIVDGFVHGAFPWFTKFAARIHDRRWVPAVERAFQLHRTAAPLWQDARPAAEVCVWDVDGPLVSPSARKAGNGIYQALVELRVPFEYVNERSQHRLFAAETRLLIMPEVSEIGLEAASAVEQFVRNGGSLVVIGTGPVKPDGNLLITELLGAQLVERRDEVVKNNYIVPAEGTGLSTGLDGAGRIIGGTRLATLRTPPAVSVDWRFVPDHPDLPMEEVYPRSEAVVPAVFGAPVGDGYVRVIAFNASELYAEVLLEDHLTLLGNVVREGLGGGSAVLLEGPGLIDCASWVQDDGYTFAFANLTGTAALRGQQRSVWPLEDLCATIDVSRLAVAAGRDVQPADLTVRVFGANGQVEETEWALDNSGAVRVQLGEVHELGAIRLDW
ncbi:family 10 glycosylhydrolase [Arthrobacter sp. JZ12]|uniref:family 10 glycosylhydrolase n=1 Tax=Arthrobacter sp. JZ12 TaxID=2654190 RepID=UPI002B489AC8|nr:family 10 glycosylhydrolase [Arthrobacter sp. JZ12]WRH24250.1 family 10 glycosylhydrolase [Arthrobacter sp. JZ12]